MIGPNTPARADIAPFVEREWRLDNTTCCQSRATEFCTSCETAGTGHRGRLQAGVAGATITTAQHARRRDDEVDFPRQSIAP